MIDYCLAKQKDGSWYYTRKWEQTSDPNADRFALGPLMDAVWFLRQLPEGKEAWKRWDAPLRQLADFQYEKWWRYAEHGYTDNVAWGSSARITRTRMSSSTHHGRRLRALGRPEVQRPPMGLSQPSKALYRGGFHYIGGDRVRYLPHAEPRVDRALLPAHPRCEARELPPRPSATTRSVTPPRRDPSTTPTAGGSTTGRTPHPTGRRSSPV